MKDDIYAEKTKLKDWKFDERVVKVFDDMVSRSVPFYPEMQKIFTDIASKFYKPNTMVYDLGSATGTTMLTILEKVGDKSMQLVGVDNSAEMIKKAKEKLKLAGVLDNCQLINADLNDDFEFKKASIVMLNWTLQFVRPMNRDTLMRKIYDALIEGGVLVISEKVLAKNALLNRLYIDLYYAFKKRQGYSEMEIAQKREELENVLIPYQIEENIKLLQKNGFKNPDVFFKYMNFAGIAAVKE